ncbi:hypothetical protein IQ273_14620 [Nodosilinea sp. LEGE 07298]|uniref:hypothetical protein n=1 Tax=Nodosilinea sp. LEGE 07298 TaxID=2777970 RepID=UPI00187F2936|nr:hypothetical protein [Nodosilinea sp. LEGE 07298]MBE9110652.1 hypothetical protein [Nodosilinea sp. LEGE 07298]
MSTILVMITIHVSTPLNDPVSTPLNDPVSTPLNDPVSTPLDDPVSTPLDDRAVVAPSALGGAGMGSLQSLGSV